MPRLEWKRPRASALALAGIVGPISFTTLVVLQGLLLPDYSHVRLPISALAAWPTGWIQNVNFYIAGVLTIAFAVALHHGVQRTRRAGAGVALLGLGGLGLVWAGIFPWKMVDGVPTETAPHVIGAVTVFTATGLGLIVFSRRMIADPRWRDLATYTMQVALRWLREDDTAVSEMASRLGYESEAAFSRAFKRFLGFSPGAVRRTKSERRSQASSAIAGIAIR